MVFKTTGTGKTSDVPTMGTVSLARFYTGFIIGMVKLQYIIYNTALTASEVLQNYNAQKSRFGL